MSKIKPKFLLLTTPKFRGGLGKCPSLSRSSWLNPSEREKFQAASVKPLYCIVLYSFIVQVDITQLIYIQLALPTWCIYESMSLVT